MATYLGSSRLGNRLNAFRLGFVSAGALAILDARSNIGRSGASRSDYYKKLNVVVEIGGVDYSRYIRHGTLNIHQAINDEPDTCGFTLVPQVPHYPAIGDEIRIGIGALNNQQFGGRVVQIQHAREAARQKPFLHCFCSDWLPDFDQRIVSYSWPKQSATTTIIDLVARFCNHQPDAQFTTFRVVADLPIIEAFSVVNQRPSDVMRKIADAIGGGFYVSPTRDVHAWSGDFEPGFTNPRALGIDTLTLKAFAHTVDATQVRTVAVVEGARTTAIAGFPAMPGGHIVGFPVADATLFRSAPIPFEIRVGSQRMMVQGQVSNAYDPTKPRSAKTTVDATAGSSPNVLTLTVDDMSFLTGHQANHGWLEIAGSYIYFNGFDVAAKTISCTGTAGWFGWGAAPTSVIKAGTVVTVVDYIWSATGTETPIGTTTPFTPMAAQVIGADVVLVVRKPSAAAARTFPPQYVEHFVSDGRYNYAGALERATIELANFDHVALSAQWDTDDPNAAPGRQQFVALDEPDPLSTSLTILSVDLTFPVSNAAARRHCVGGAVKRANLLDLLVTTKD